MGGSSAESSPDPAPLHSSVRRYAWQLDRDILRLAPHLYSAAERAQQRARFRDQYTRFRGTPYFITDKDKAAASNEAHFSGKGAKLDYEELGRMLEAAFPSDSESVVEIESDGHPVFEDEEVLDDETLAAILIAEQD